jgi:hypothetical protein
MMVLVLSLQATADASRLFPTNWWGSGCEDGKVLSCIEYLPPIGCECVPESILSLVDRQAYMVAAVGDGSYDRQLSGNGDFN